MGRARNVWMLALFVGLAGLTVDAGRAQQPSAAVKSLDTPTLLNVLMENSHISGNVVHGIAARQELARRGKADPATVVPLLVARLGAQVPADRKGTAAFIAIMGVLQDMGPAAADAVDVLARIANDTNQANDWVKGQARAALLRIGTPTSIDVAAKAEGRQLDAWRDQTTETEKIKSLGQNAYFIRAELRRAQPRPERIMLALGVFERLEEIAVTEAPTLLRALGDPRLGEILRQRVQELVERLDVDPALRDGRAMTSDPVDQLRTEIGNADPLIASLAMAELKQQATPDQILAILSDALARGIQPGDAARLLGELGSKAEPAVPLLLAHLNNDDAVPNILQALGRIGLADRAVSNAILATLNDPRGRHRGAAATAAGALTLKQAVPSLVAALADQHKYTRILAVKALGRMGPSAAEAVPSLSSLLKDPDRDLRLVAVEALGAVGKASRSSVAEIGPLLEQPDSRLATAASTALQRIGGSQAAALLSLHASRFADADLRRFLAIRQREDKPALARFLRQLPEFRLVPIARRMTQDNDPLIVYHGVGILVRNKLERETFPVLVRLIANGANDPDGPLHGRMGYDWVHSEDQELAARMTRGIVEHGRSVINELPRDQQRRLRMFLDGARP